MSKVAPDRDSLTTRIVNALQDSGRPIDELTYRDLIPVSELHNRGKQATVDLARLAEIQPEQHVLDVGCGIGGPARTLAAEFGCRVTGIDISDEFCSAAQSLNELVGLSDKNIHPHRRRPRPPLRRRVLRYRLDPACFHEHSRQAGPIYRDAPGSPTRRQARPSRRHGRPRACLFTSPSPGPRTHP